MQLRHITTGMAALAAIATLLAPGSAQAFSFKVTSGVASLTGATDQGAFSEFAGLKGTTTVDFNAGSVPTTGFAKYSFQNTSNASSVRQDMWAPVGAAGEKNTSNYLAVFDGDRVTIDLEKNLNYFGIDWGAAHPGNTYAFYNGNKLVHSFNTSDIDQAGGFAIYSALHPGSNEGGAKQQANGSYAQGNGYVHFYADSKDEVFNRIVISQSGGGGFETDNHSFHEGDDAFNYDHPESVPEPGMIVGLGMLGGRFLLRRRQRQAA